MLAFVTIETNDTLWIPLLALLQVVRLDGTPLQGLQQPRYAFVIEDAG